jgi:hypothetical protein
MMKQPMQPMSNVVLFARNISTRRNSIETFCKSIHQAVTFEFSGYKQGNVGPLSFVFSNHSNSSTTVEFKMWQSSYDSWLCSASFNEVVFSEPYAASYEACADPGQALKCYTKHEISQFDMPYKTFNKVDVCVDGGRKACMERIIIDML